MWRLLARSSPKRAAGRGPDGARPRSLFVWGIVIAVVAWVSPAAASTVVLLEHLRSDEPGLELSARVRGELHAAGFQVVVLALPEHLPTDQAAARVARDLDPAAVLVVREIDDSGNDVPVAELWIWDRAQDRARGHRVLRASPDSRNAVAKFAVQVAELVKAGLAELSIAGAPPPRPVDAVAPTSAPEPTPIPVAPESRGGGWLLGAGLGVLTDIVARETSLMPLVRAGAILGGEQATFDVELRGTFGAFGTSNRVADGPASAELDQAIASADVVFRFAKGWSLQPALFAGAGVYTLRARGIAPEGYVTRSRRAWSALATAGAGIAYVPASWLRWNVDAQFLASASPAVVRLADRDSEERGAWLALFSTGVSVGAF